MSQRKRDFLPPCLPLLAPTSQLFLLTGIPSCCPPAALPSHTHTWICSQVCSCSPAQLLLLSSPRIPRSPRGFLSLSAPQHLSLHPVALLMPALLPGQHWILWGKSKFTHVYRSQFQVKLQGPQLPFGTDAIPCPQSEHSYIKAAVERDPSEPVPSLQARNYRFSGLWMRPAM